VTRTVLFLHPWASGYGADRQLHLLVGGLDRERYRPVVVLGDDGPLAQDLADAGADVAVRPLTAMRRRLAAPGALVGTGAGVARDVAAVGSLARRLRAAIVHTNTSTVLAGQGIARAAGAAHVLHVREIYEGAGPALLWPVLRRGLLRADRVVCVSAATAAQFRGAPNVVVVCDAVRGVPVLGDRAEARAALGLPEDAFVVAVIGRLSDWKGQAVLVRALAEPPLAAAGAIALVAGGPAPGQEEHRDAIVRAARDLGVADRVRMLGFRDDLGAVLRAADVLAAPSTHPDPLPNAALEAASVGLPVVASRCGGLPEIVRDGETGLLVEPGDPASLAGAIADLAADPALRRRFGEAARADIAERFAAEPMFAALHAQYDAVLAERAR
jgi:hypothetical protein